MINKTRKDYSQFMLKKKLDPFCTVLIVSLVPHLHHRKLSEKDTLSQIIIIHTILIQAEGIAVNKSSHKTFY